MIYAKKIGYFEMNAHKSVPYDASNPEKSIMPMRTDRKVGYDDVMLGLSTSFISYFMAYFIISQDKG